MAGTALGMEGCTTMPIYRAEMAGSKLQIPLAKFAETPVMMVRNSSLEFDVLVMQNADKSFTALLLKCTHFSNALVLSGGSLTCPMHGSTFSMDGSVTQGPAEQPLQKLPVAVQDDFVQITLIS